MKKIKKKRKYRLYALTTGSKLLGEVEAESEEKAQELGWNRDECFFSLCHQCAREAELGDVEEIQVELVE